MSGYLDIILPFGARTPHGPLYSRTRAFQLINLPIAQLADRWIAEARSTQPSAKRRKGQTKAVRTARRRAKKRTAWVLYWVGQLGPVQ